MRTKPPIHPCSPNSSLRATSLTRRQVLAGAAAAAAYSMLPVRGWAASNPQPVPSGTLTNASLTVTSTAQGTLGSAFVGLSYPKSAMIENPRLFGTAPSNANLIGLFQLLGPSLLRVGGTAVDDFCWTPTGLGQTKAQIAPSDVDALAAFVKAAGWQILYGVNLAGGNPAYDTEKTAAVATTPQLAAEEVAYVAQAFGSSLYGIEIGNEPNLYGNMYYGDSSWGVSDYETLWGQFRTAILDQTPGVLITGPAAVGAVSSWTVPFAEAVGKNDLGLITEHYYVGSSAGCSAPPNIGSSCTATVQALITPDPNLTSTLSALQSCSKKVGIPYRMAECNSYTGDETSYAADSYASTLWVIDYLFTCVMADCVGVNMHGGGDGTDDQTSYTPISDSGGVALEARPEYYGMLLFTLAEQGWTHITQLTVPDGLNVTAYAVKTKAENINIVVNNKDATNNLELSITLYQSIAAANLIELTQLTTGASGPDLSANTGITIQGASVSNAGAFTPGAAYTLTPDGTQLTCYVPALSAVLIKTT